MTKEKLLEVEIIDKPISEAPDNASLAGYFNAHTPSSDVPDFFAVRFSQKKALKNLLIFILTKTISANYNVPQNQDQ